VVLHAIQQRWQLQQTASQLLIQLPLEAQHALQWQSHEADVVLTVFVTVMLRYQLSVASYSSHRSYLYHADILRPTNWQYPSFDLMIRHRRTSPKLTLHASKLPVHDASTNVMPGLPKGTVRHICFLSCLPIDA